ncbi:hypothetical protein GE061_007888 [Apolygus lucorum]|uniref:Uncharacterized protein n=1 Tax=Apolygus lucorum TaxID=248454 RepID=A0A8S9WPS7_APOLU|nr:hypothetical protein GE061_007888 [Apolygus lucorum]
MKKVKVSLKTSSSEDAVTSSSTVSPEEEARNPLDESRANAFATSGDATPDEGDSSPVDASAAESALLEGLASEVVVPEVVYSLELSTSRVLDEVTFVDEIVGNVDWDERDATAKKGGATPQTRRSKASPRKISPRDFVVSLGRLYRAGRHTCILCPIHSAALSRQDEEAVRNLSLDALAFVDKLSAPSNMDAFRSSDVFGRSEIVWQSEVLKSLDDDPVPSTSKSPPTSAPTSPLVARSTSRQCLDVSEPRRRASHRSGRCLRRQPQFYL